jgi:hypothetical protein
MRRLATFLLVSLAVVVSAGSAGNALAARHREPASPQAEIFATSNTAIITDANDPRLRTRLIPFEHEVDRIISQGGSEPEESTLLDGVFWSASLNATTYERSREFDVTDTSLTRLHDTAHVIASRFHQESVLTFELLPRTSPRTDAVQVEVPGVDVRALHDTLVADQTAREHLQGGSVTLGHHLILIADLADLPLVQHVVTELGASWPAATLHYGAWQFVP